MFVVHVHIDTAAKALWNSAVVLAFLVHLTPVLLEAFVFVSVIGPDHGFPPILMSVHSLMSMDVASSLSSY